MRQLIEIIVILVFCGINYYFHKGVDFLPIYLLVGIVGALSVDVLRILNKPQIYKRIAVAGLFLLVLLIPDMQFFIPAFLYSAFLTAGTPAFVMLLFLWKSEFVSIGLSVISLYLSYRLRESQKTTGDSMKKTAEIMDQMISLEKYNGKLRENEVKNAEITRLEERNRIARQLHDALGHTISSSILQVEALKVTEPNALRQEKLQVLQDTLNNGMIDIRKQLHGMYDNAFSLNRRLEELQDLTPDIRLKLQNDIVTKLSFGKERDIYNLVREAFTNTMKHSDATAFQVYLKEQGSSQIIFLSDNGTQAPPEIKQGMGLSGMEEIALKYNGKINYYYRNGFHLHIVLLMEEN